jgi:hypothetical protein
MSANPKSKKISPLDLWEQKKAPTVNSKKTSTSTRFIQNPLSEMEEIHYLKQKIEAQLQSTKGQKNAVHILEAWLKKT